MLKLFSAALLSAYTLAEQAFEDQAVARELAAQLEQDIGRELSQENIGIDDERILEALAEGIASGEDHRELHSQWYRHRHWNPYPPPNPTPTPTPTPSPAEQARTANVTTNTFRNGKNRKAGFYTRYAADYKLASSIIVARTGERDPGVGGYDVVATDPDFATTDKSLTAKGVATMNALGTGIKAHWAKDNATLQNWLNTVTYDQNQVYAYAGSTDRMNDSAIALLDGIFATTPLTHPITAELATIAAYPGSAQPVAADDKLMMATPASSCARIGAIDAAIAANAGTVALKTKITTYLEGKYFPRLKVLLANDALTSAQLYQVADVIEWAQQNGLTLAVGPTDSDLTATEKSYNKMAVDADNYEEFALTDDQWYPQTQELQKLMIEISQVVRGALTIENTVIARKYFPTQTAGLGGPAPKLVAAVGDEETMKALLGTFENLYLPTPESGSVFAIDIYQKTLSPTETYVEVSYCPDGTDLANTCTLLKYDRSTKRSDYWTGYRGYNNASTFEAFLSNNLASYESKAGLLPTPPALSVSIETACAAPFVATKPYQSTDRFYKDILKTNGLPDTVTPTPTPTPHPFPDPFDFNSHSHPGYVHSHYGGYWQHTHSSDGSSRPCRWPFTNC